MREGNKRKEKKRMLELLKSEDQEMVQLGITLMKHLLKRDKWEETLLLAFAIIENGRFVGQKWEWQISEDNEVAVEKPISDSIWNGWNGPTTTTYGGPYTYISPYWIGGSNGTSTNTNITIGTSTTCTPLTYSSGTTTYTI